MAGMFNSQRALKLNVGKLTGIVVMECWALEECWKRTLKIQTVLPCAKLLSTRCHVTSCDYPRAVCGVSRDVM